MAMRANFPDKATNNSTNTTGVSKCHTTPMDLLLKLGFTQPLKDCGFWIVDPYHWVVRMDQDHLPTWQQVVDVFYEEID
jgi:hypothetical protein